MVTRASCRSAVPTFAAAWAAALLFGAPAEAQALINNQAAAIASDILPDGEHRVVFVTQEQLVPEDTDSSADIYVRRMPPSGAPVTELVSKDDSPPFGGAFWQGLGAQAGVIYGRGVGNANPFDHTIFVFMRRNGSWTRFVSAAGNVTPRGLLNDGSQVIATDAALVPGDDNSSCDIYRITPPKVGLGFPVPPAPVLLTPGVGSGRCPELRGGFVLPNGNTRIVFETDRPLRPDLDHDVLLDVYGRVGNGPYQLFSRASGPPQNVEHISVVGTSFLGPSTFKDDFGDAVSPEADTVIFRTAEKLVPEDTDGDVSFYVGRFGTTTPLLIPGDGVGKLILNGFLFFESKAPLAGNIDDDIDIFRMNLASGALLHVSRSRSVLSYPFPPVEIDTRDASFIGAASDGSRVWFRSFGGFGVPHPTPGDVDDLYEAKLDFAPGSPDHLRNRTRSRNTTSHGLILGDPFVSGSMPSQQINSMFLGSTVLFKSMRQLASVEEAGAGNPNDFDVYALTGNVVRLVTTPTTGDHAEDPESFVLGFGGTPFRGAHWNFQPQRGSDERLVVFETVKSLADTDTDREVDVYVRNISTGTTTHVSVP
jgi:hypothetical protein